MANEAHKEPTMEEILASIKKIISDDEPKPATGRKAPPPPPLMAAGNDLEDLDFGLDEDASDDSFFEAEADAFEEDPPLDTPAAPSFEAMLGTVRAVASAPPAAIVVPEPQPQPRPPEPTRTAKAPIPETDMQSTQRYQQTVLTDDNTADAAAGALGKLISKMEMGGDNTIEGLVREMLKPMIKDWLDANLPKIVDQKVEAEVQRIARMAR